MKLNPIWTPCVLYPLGSGYVIRVPLPIKNVTGQIIGMTPPQQGLLSCRGRDGRRRFWLQLRRLTNYSRVHHLEPN